MRSISILLVEDNQLLRWWMASSLQRDGCHVTAPKSVEEALACAEASFDLLITDWRLADGHTGLEILQRARAAHPGILTVLVSAEADVELAARARASGFDIVIEKPFPAAEIVGAVHSLANRASSSAVS